MMGYIPPRPFYPSPTRQPPLQAPVPGEYVQCRTAQGGSWLLYCGPERFEMAVWDAEFERQTGMKVPAE